MKASACVLIHPGKKLFLANNKKEMIIKMHLYASVATSFEKCKNKSSTNVMIILEME